MILYPSMTSGSELGTREEEEKLRSWFWNPVALSGFPKSSVALTNATASLIKERNSGDFCHGVGGRAR